MERKGSEIHCFHNTISHVSQGCYKVVHNSFAIYGKSTRVQGVELYLCEPNFFHGRFRCFG